MLACRLTSVRRRPNSELGYSEVDLFEGRSFEVCRAGHHLH